MNIRPEDRFDFKDPQYAEIWNERCRRLTWLREKQGRIETIKTFYRADPIQMIEDWGGTIDQRLKGAQRLIPLVLMPKQKEMLQWILERLKAAEPGVLEKSRDVGASVLSMALSCVLCILNDDVSIGFGSAKEDKLDRSGDPNTLFFKGRTFMQYLPPEFKAGFNPDKNAPHMRMIFPHTRSSIIGDTGDNMWRGGRLLMGYLDEAAHLEHPELVDAATSAVTDCVISMSSVNGMSNSFAQKRHSGQFKVFTFHYRDDLRKDAAWAEKKKGTVDPVIWNAEYELDYTSSVEGIIIPQQHVQAAIDAHKKLGVSPEGTRFGSLDVADEGRDKNAFAARHGMLVFHCSVWSGKDSDIFATTERMFMLMDELQLDGACYDADGLGAGVRGDATRIAARRALHNQTQKSVEPFRGSAAVFMPDMQVMGTDRLNKDHFQNCKAQSWWHLKQLFLHTFRAVNGQQHDPEYLISLDSSIPDLQKLCIELSQPQWKLSTTGKLVCEKVGDGLASPNMADSVMQLMSLRAMPLNISDDALDPDPFGANDDWSDDDA